jgi:hypothetical protein
MNEEDGITLPRLFISNLDAVRTEAGHGRKDMLPARLHKRFSRTWQWQQARHRIFITTLALRPLKSGPRNSCASAPSRPSITRISLSIWAPRVMPFAHTVQPGTSLMRRWVPAMPIRQVPSGMANRLKRRRLAGFRLSTGFARADRAARTSFAARRRSAGTSILSTLANWRRSRPLGIFS